VAFFESKLKKKYTEMTKEAAYFEFLTDWSYRNLNTNFFSDDSSDSIHKQIRNLEIWNESLRSEENMEREPKLFNVESMNPIRLKLDKDISRCLVRQTKAEGIVYFLMDNSKYRISPRLAQKRLFRTNEHDLKENVNRMIIALGVYYQTSFNIN